MIPTLPRWAWGLAGLFAVLVALWLWGNGRYHAGERHERAAWEAKSAEMKAQAEQLQRMAGDLRNRAETLQRAALARNRQEVDNALRDIPDQGVSARQRARACIELRRQGQNPAACQPQPAGKSADPRR